jgi:hypothetical protein
MSSCERSSVTVTAVPAARPPAAADWGAGLLTVDRIALRTFE